jgi:hypothetical protein
LASVFGKHAATIHGTVTGRRNTDGAQTLRTTTRRAIDPVEGGSANNYDYVNGDPINNLDLGGTMCFVKCGWTKFAKKHSKVIGRLTTLAEVGAFAFCVGATAGACFAAGAALGAVEFGSRSVLHGGRSRGIAAQAGIDIALAYVGFKLGPTSDLLYERGLSRSRFAARGFKWGFNAWTGLLGSAYSHQAAKALHVE